MINLSGYDVDRNKTREKTKLWRETRKYKHKDLINGLDTVKEYIN
jgi:hypothetical protein